MRASRRLLSIALMLCLAATGCESEGGSAQPSTADWEPDSFDYVLSYKIACDDPCDQMAGSYELIYRRGEPSAARRIPTNRQSRQDISRHELHLLPSPGEILGLSEPGAELDGHTGLPDTVRRGDMILSNIDITYDIADATAALDAARNEWAAAGVTDYRLSYRVGCFCQVTGGLTFEVRDGEPALVDSERNLDPSDVPGWLPRTVEELFDVIDRRILQPRPEYFALDFDATGVPIKFSGDEVNTIDEEFSYGSISIEVLPP